MNSPYYLVRLNRVDLITLSAVPTTMLAMALSLAHRPLLATSLLFLAMLGDALDGMLARHLGLVRPFGRYLDGFMDVLIYLLSPALILYGEGFNGFWSVGLILMVGCGLIRLAVFNDTGNIEDARGGLAYRGMPVFWSLFLLAAMLLIHGIMTLNLWRLLTLILLLLFSHAMLLHRPFFKFTRLWQILSLTLGGALLFLILDLTGRAS
ncbi:MAG: CDP-diacylglycerol--serine O-phosphatidyltransferase [Pseudomonadales bacterium]|nr:CDP-diacylglycerol--serine O-phosphatidyltransferase [Pseudomonadales bacterium]